MKQREQQKAASRAAIVRSAATLVRQAGVDGTSVPGAMRGAGLTQGAFYAHFGSKDELLAEAFDMALAEAGELIVGAAEGKRGSPAVAAVADAYLSEEHRDRPEIGCPLPGMLGEAATTESERVGQLLAGGAATMRQRLGTVAGGDVADDALLASMVLMIGGQIVARALGDTPLSGDVLRACRTAVAELAAGSETEDQR